MKYNNPATGSDMPVFFNLKNEPMKPEPTKTKINQAHKSWIMKRSWQRLKACRERNISITLSECMRDAWLFLLQNIEQEYAEKRSAWLQQFPKWDINQEMEMIMTPETIEDARVRGWSLD